MEKELSAREALLWLLYLVVGMTVAAFVACLLFGCAGTNTTKWAMAQDSLFSHDSPPQRDCDRLARFQRLRDSQHASIPTNLTIRHDVGTAFCRDRGDLLDSAWGDLEAQLDAGHGWWPEYFSYWMYTRRAFDWYKVSDERRNRLDAVTGKYLAIVAPDGTIPLPETRADPVTMRLARDFSDSSFTVKRWRDDSGRVVEYFLLSTQTDAGPERNLHHKPDFGYYAHWRRGKWLHRAPPYTGWEEKELGREAHDLGVPLGPWSDPAWRIRRTCERKASIIGSRAALLTFDCLDHIAYEYAQYGDSAKISTWSFP